MQNPEEAYGLKIISDPFVSGHVVYFTMNWIGEGEYRSSIYRFDGKDCTRVTFGGRERNPAIQGGKLYYVSYTKEEETLMELEAMKETRALYTNRSISKFVFHGDSLLIIAQDTYDSEKPFSTDRLKYRFDTTGFLRTRKKLILFDGKATDLVTGDFDVVDVDSDGTRVVFSATIEDDDRGMQDVYDLDTESRSYRRITEGTGEAGHVGLDKNRKAVYIGHRKGISPWAASALVFPESGNEVMFGNNTGNTVGCDLFVSASQSLINDSGRLYAIGQEGGSSSVYSYDGERVQRLTGSGMSVRSFHVSGGRLAYVYTSPEKPSVLVFGESFDPNPEVKGREPERFEVDGKEAWIMLNSREAPTVLNVHGGPQTAYGYAYSIEFNFLVNNGYNVLYGNPRGSDGYGEDFARGCVGDWGGKDFQDLLGFVEYARKKYSLEGGFAISGGSYGGYMTNAAIVQTEMFRCAISERCVSNLMSMCGTSDIGFWFNAIESGVDEPWSEEGMKKLLELSPITRAGNVKTPTMFIHGEEDYRCPIEQSEQMYTAIRVNGVESVLVRYPGDSHEHARRGVPSNMADRLERKLGWYHRFMPLKTKGD